MARITFMTALCYRRYSGRFKARDSLDLQIIGEAMRTPLTAITRLLVAAKGNIHSWRSAVNVHVARADAGRNATGMIEVAALHVSCQSVRRIVGNPDGFLFTVIGQHGKHRTKYLLLCDRHVI